MLIGHAGVTCHPSPLASWQFTDLAHVFSLAFCLFSSHSTVFPVLPTSLLPILVHPMALSTPWLCQPHGSVHPMALPPAAPTATCTCCSCCMLWLPMSRFASFE